MKSAAPIRWRLHASFFLFGLAQLLPWNLYMKSVPFFRTKLAGSHFADNMAGSMSSAFTTCNMIAMIVLVIFRVDEWAMSTSSRVVLGISGNALLILAMIGLCFVNVSDEKLFWMVISIVGMAGLFTSFMMKGLYGMLAKFPSTMTPALLSGQAAVGFIISSANLLSTFINRGKSADQIGTVIYFTVGVSIMLLAVSVYIWNYYRSPVFREYMGIAMIGDEENSSEKMHRAPFRMLLRVLKRLRWYALGIMMALAVTINIFATFITSPRVAFAKDSFMTEYDYLYGPVIFILYDIGDLLGRWLPAIPSVASSAKNLRFVEIFPWFRLVVLPLFFAISPLEIGGIGPKPEYLGREDFTYALLVFLFGFSNGYSNTLLLMHAPSVGVKKDPLMMSMSPTLCEKLERESCGSLMGLFLNFGLVIGSYSSFLWKFILKE